eukprot:4662046-Ditylum_brightwellii.AAC.2
MLLHVSIYCPEVSDLMLWIFALQYTVDLWNKLPDVNVGLLLLDIFSGIVLDHTELLNSHVWGFSVYVLGPMLQDGKKLPKWNVWKQQGQFLGWSKNHAPTVALIYNLRIGSIMPQIHAVMGNWFTMIAHMNTDDDFLPPDNWEDLF